MLDGSTDANGHVKVRCHNLAGLADLHVVGHVAGIHSCARSTNCAVLTAKGLGKVVKHLEVLSILKASSSTNNEFGATKIRVVALGDDVLLPGALQSLSDGLCRLYRVSVAGLTSLHLLKVGRTHRQKLDRITCRDSSDSISSVDGSLKLLASLSDLNYVRDGLHVEHTSKSRHNILAKATGSSNYLVVAAGLHDFLSQFTH